jgi:hypothetical protein
MAEDKLRYLRSCFRKTQMVNAAAVEGSRSKASTPILANANSDNNTILFKYLEKAHRPTAVQEGQVFILSSTGSAALKRKKILCCKRLYV